MNRNSFDKYMSIFRSNKLFTGGLLVVLGLIFLLAPGSATVTAVRFGGYVLLVYAVGEAVTAFRNGGVRSPIFLNSILSLLLALWLIRRPASVVASINLVFGLVILVSALTSLLGTISDRQRGHINYPMAALAGAGAILGLFIILRPFGLINTVVRIIGLVLIYQGVVNVIFAKRWV